MRDDRAPVLFVCHHSSRLAVVEELEQALNARGVRCWVAPRDIDPGEPFDRSIRSAIEHADALLLLFCSAAERSRHVKREIILADQIGKPIIPMRLEKIKAADLAYHLADAQWVNWMDRGTTAIDRVAAKAHEICPAGDGEATPPADAPVSLERRPSVQRAERSLREIEAELYGGEPVTVESLGAARPSAAPRAVPPPPPPRPWGWAERIGLVGWRLPAAVGGGVLAFGGVALLAIWTAPTPDAPAASRSPADPVAENAPAAAAPAEAPKGNETGSAFLQSVRATRNGAAARSGENGVIGTAVSGDEDWFPDD